MPEQHRDTLTHCACGRPWPQNSTAHTGVCWACDRIRPPFPESYYDDPSSLEDDYRNSGHWAMGQHHL